MLLNGRQIKIHGKEQKMILLVIEDITKRKKADTILKRDKETLEKIISQRSREFLDLKIRMERSKYLSDVGTLAATVAHELRNTLAGINVAAYNIRKRVQDPQVEGILNSIDKQVLEGDQIINNVLSYSKIKISYFTEVKLNDILRLCINESKDLAIKQNCAVHDSLDETEGLSIEADPTQLKEVFTNILNNALDAISKDVGEIKFETKIENSRATILISDNGEGISGEDLKKITSPFFTTKAKGTGLGLAVCHQIIMLHDGTMVIKSSKGRGTTVKLSLLIRRNKNDEKDTINR
jgi:signal transduction histidine kinase